MTEILSHRRQFFYGRTSLVGGRISWEAVVKYMSLRELKQ
jgi:hypothetical protein